MGLSLYALALIVVGSFAYAATDLLRKLLAAEIRPLPLLFFITAGPAPLFAAWLALAGGSEIDAGYIVPGGVSVALNVVSNVAFLEAVRLGQLSTTIPYLSLTPVFTTLLAVPLLGERPAPVQLLGILVVVVGAFRLSTGGGDAAVGGASAHDRKGMLLMVGVALLWSLAIPLDKLAITSSSPAFHGLVLNLGVAVATLGLLAARGRLGELRVPRVHWVRLLVLVVLSMAALALMLVALTLTWAGLVETLKRAIGSVLALALGRWFFAERVTAAKVVAVGLMSGGVALILLL